MNSENIYSLFLCILMMAVTLSFGMEEESSSGSIYMSGDQLYANCKTVPSASIKGTQSSETPEMEKKQKQSTPVKGAASLATSCNTLQVLTVEKQQLIPPAAYSFSFPSFASAITSQSFVFQEPDPPQTA